MSHFELWQRIAEQVRKLTMDEVRVEIARRRGFYIREGKLWYTSRGQNVCVLYQGGIETLQEALNSLPHWESEAIEFMELMKDGNIALFPVEIYKEYNEKSGFVGQPVTKWNALAVDLNNCLTLSGDGNYLGNVDEEFSIQDTFDRPGEAISRRWLINAMLAEVESGDDQRGKDQA